LVKENCKDEGFQPLGPTKHINEGGRRWERMGSGGDCGKCSVQASQLQLAVALQECGVGVDRLFLFLILK
jgi:hypothetical protein